MGRHAARQRAVATLRARGLLERRAATGQRIGIQSKLSLSPDGAAALDLGEICGPARVAEQRVEDDATREDLLELLAGVERRLGFPIEPEFFSNMVFVAYLGHLDDHGLGELVQGLLETYRSRSLFGLYGFFGSMRFACDVDCTGVAMWGRIVAGDINFNDEADAAELRATTTRILKSASIKEVSAAANETRGRSDGGLRRDVFKVYLDDHEVQGALLDRGLKQDVVAVCHALNPVLAEIAAGRRSLDESVPLTEFHEGSREPRQRTGNVRQIVRANLEFIATHLSEGWRAGTRYYPMPEAFLCSASELCVGFPELTTALDIRAGLVAALHEQRRTPAVNVLALALRVITAGNLGLDASEDIAELLRCEARDGFVAFAPYYRMPSTKRIVHFGSAEQTLSFVIRALSGRESAARRRAAMTPRGEAALAPLAGPHLTSLDG